MNILQLDIPGSRVVDLFCGTGALGLEALSRGAESAEFVESDARSIRVLRDNIDLLGAGSETNVRRADALRFAKGLGRHEYGIAFADPPWAGGGAAALASLWLEQPFARILSVEHDSRENLTGASDTRRYGSSAVTFFLSED